MSERWALFLDVDGTLVPFADDPEQVYVSPRLVDRLGALSSAMDGAVALVSGRHVDVLDRLFAPLRLAAAGLHGLQRRRAGEAL
ncbi:trehalose-phosphatase, partial [Luteimonas sp. SDU101]|uniref:trehalose-phosphatase n=1 Tax=Luteimonas sp. SDU101 TaxID=3422593 RepID=UPI003EBD0D62